MNTALQAIKNDLSKSVTERNLAIVAARSNGVLNGDAAQVVERLA